ncbi:MAG: ROK family protein [Planctomycetia bacterium]|nr:ROK family protein [Planctomycetia bacterium]
MKNVLAIDIGGSKMMAAMVEIFFDAAGGGWNFKMLQSVQQELRGEVTETRILDQIDAFLRELGGVEAVESIGVTIPGLADERVWIYAPFSGIENFPIVDELANRYGRPVFIENDVNACARAEWLFGACRGIHDFLWMTVSNGIGGALFLDDKIYSGSQGFSGEFGHITVVDDGEKCGCGKRGCLEAECAGPGISRYYARLTGENLSALEIAQRFAAGDENARKTWEREGVVLGRTLANLANVLNPAKVILGGGVSRSWDLFAPSLNQTFQKNLFARANAGLVVERTALGYEAALFGAVALNCK